jgi:adenylate cyclase
MKRTLHLTALRVSLLVTLGVIVLYWTTVHSTLVRNVEAKLLDLRFQLRGIQSPAAPVVVVLIDDRSIAELGRWPWSRQRFSEMVRRLHTAGARVIAFDLLFSEAQTNPTHEALQAMRQALAALYPASSEAAWQALQQVLRTLPAAADADAEFATTVQAAGNVLLAFSFDVATSAAPPRDTAAAPPFLGQAAYRTIRRPEPEPPWLPLVATDVLTPIAPLAQAARALGHVRVAFDTDGTPRYEYPIVPYQDAYYPSFALQAARLYLGLAPEDMALTFGQGIQLGDLAVATDEAMRLLVNYYGPPGTFPTYSFADVLQDRLPGNTFRDQIVLIGAGAAGLGDTVVTPYTAALSGVERQATVIANVLRGEALQRRNATALLDLACMAGLGLLLSCLSARLPRLWGTLLALLLAGGYLALNFLAFTQFGLWVHLLFPLLTIGASQGSITLYKLLTEERQKRIIRRAFQHYVDPSVVEQVAQHPERLTLGGEKRQLTVLFSDIRGFSTFAEGLAPEALVQLLNDYMSAMTQVVLAEQGMLDKYIGDAVMAVYGAPRFTPDHAYLACRTALGMLDVLHTLQPRWQAQGLPLIDIGIGINSGAMVIGNMGSAEHLEYTVIGDEVNLGARLEDANKVYGTHIIISESTWSQVRDRIATRELDVIRVKGKENPTRIFEVLGFAPLPAVQEAMVQQFEAALRAYRAQCWAAARHCFEQALHYASDDLPSQLYIQRCAAYEAAPPAAEWDGVYSLQTM